MDEVIPVADLSAEELRRLLIEGDDFRNDEIAEFVSRIGGPENAWLAVEMLYRLEHWAI